MPTTEEAIQQLTRQVDRQAAEYEAMMLALKNSDLRMEDLRVHFITVLGEREARQQERTAFEQKALAVALTANDKRLDNMEELRVALSNTSSQMMTRKECETAISTMGARLDAKTENLDQQVDAKLEPINAQLVQLGKPNLSLLLSSMSVVVALIVGGWAIIGLTIDASNAPMPSTSSSSSRARSTATAKSSSSQNAYVWSKPTAWSCSSPVQLATPTGPR